MWRRFTTHLRTTALSESTRFTAASANICSSPSPSTSYLRTTHLRTTALSESTGFTAASANICSSPSPSTSSLRPSVSIFSRHFASQDGENVVTRVEDVMPIATGHEREELEAELQGRKILKDTESFVGPFGTEEAPAFIQSYYDKRIVGCSGGEGEDEHDVVWFWLEKGKPHECPVCSQYFMLEVIGPGGPPDGHGDDDDDH